MYFGQSLQGSTRHLKRPTRQHMTIHGTTRDRSRRPLIPAAIPPCDLSLHPMAKIPFKEPRQLHAKSSDRELGMNPRLPHDLQDPPAHTHTHTYTHTSRRGGHNKLPDRSPTRRRQEAKRGARRRHRRDQRSRCNRHHRCFQINAHAKSGKLCFPSESLCHRGTKNQLLGFPGPFHSQRRH